MPPVSITMGYGCDTPPTSVLEHQLPDPVAGTRQIVAVCSSATTGVPIDFPLLVAAKDVAASIGGQAARRPAGRQRTEQCLDRPVGRAGQVDRRGHRSERVLAPALVLSRGRDWRRRG